jgi:hypothetical protein
MPRGLSDVLSDEMVEFLARNDLDDTIQDVGCHAVFPDLSRLMGERKLG